MTIVDSSIFDSFNAKNLKPKQVAESFVPPSVFGDVLKRRHTLLLGPRGSGKTTLLKMLDTQTVGYWNDDLRATYPSNPDFIGVFIPADRAWHDQIELFSQDAENTHFERHFRTSLFTLHVLQYLTTAFGFITEKKPLSATEEANLVNNLSVLWQLQPLTHSLASLKTAVLLKKSELMTLGLKRSYISSSIKPELDYILNFHDAISNAIEIFDNTTQKSSGDKKWALLFDELELAPKGLLNFLINLTRDCNEKLILKLSLAPYTTEFSEETGVHASQDGQDFDVLNLWYAKKDIEKNKFCESLLEKMLERHSITDISSVDMLGSTDMSDVEKENMLEEILNIDNALAKYLDNRNIKDTKGDERAAKYRKPFPIIRARHEFLTKENMQHRSRKAIPHMYAGKESMFNMVEANPRWFIGIFNPLVNEFANTRKKLDKRKQLELISKAQDKFVSLLKNLPISSQSQTTAKGIDELLEHIGNYLSKGVMSSEFNPEPPLSFVVDNALPEPVLSGIGSAINAGALILVDTPRNTVTTDNLYGMRLRISYLLASKYKLPLILGKSISLSKILGDRNQNQSTGQSDLF